MSTILFALAAILNSLVALLHFVAIYIGGPAYRSLGAGETLATAADNGSFFPGILTGLIGFVFTAFGLYALSGGGFTSPLPYLAPALYAISALYCARGLGLLGFIVPWYQMTRFDVITSFVSLLIGLTHLAALRLSGIALPTLS